MVMIVSCAGLGNTKPPSADDSRPQLPPLPCVVMATEHL